MKHEKTFAAIDKLKEVELELHRLKNALEMANKALDAKRKWVGLTAEEEFELDQKYGYSLNVYIDQRDMKLKEKNT